MRAIFQTLTLPDGVTNVPVVITIHASRVITKN
jgi:hypothetical protein